MGAESTFWGGRKCFRLRLSCTASLWTWLWRGHSMVMLGASIFFVSGQRDVVWTPALAVGQAAFLCLWCPYWDNNTITRVVLRTSNKAFCAGLGKSSTSNSFSLSSSCLIWAWWFVLMAKFTESRLGDGDFLDYINWAGQTCLLRVAPFPGWDPGQYKQRRNWRTVYVHVSLFSEWDCDVTSFSTLRH